MGTCIGGLCIDCSLVQLYTNPEAQKVSGFFVLYLSVVQSGRMPALGAGGREFDPLHSDQVVKVVML